MKVKELMENLSMVNSESEIRNIIIKGLPDERPHRYKIKNIDVCDVLSITSLRSDDGFNKTVDLECKTNEIGE